ncbi:hypothetical protein [Yersinia intermedia]|uniref:hypothetical protein n=1 Tax=Yersinia intermedia TaxID=631 RepID=UPI001CFD039A|nr:hypothetical protein [Yersinia intermedia]MCB5311956.1 hypothetical protein [Yersinia intermedia]MCB5325318.1 hypothetical protein [Yersinia intermedia]
MHNYKSINSILLQFKNKKVSRETFIGIIVSLILNKELFKTNQDVVKFTSLAFDLNFPMYITRSRTLMVARICRVLFNSDEKSIEKFSNMTSIYLNNILSQQSELNLNTADKYKNTRNDALSNMNKWIGGILKKDK